eukprot:c12094_g1_i1.p1 GENE.c12094_g1_i1~~c12094_g1_i1.p1  ORF type:complete len:227 (+),score=95.14 c12094_g1_i1:36-683(+)
MKLFFVTLFVIVLGVVLSIPFESMDVIHTLEIEKSQQVKAEPQDSKKVITANKPQEAAKVSQPTNVKTEVNKDVKISTENKQQNVKTETTTTKAAKAAPAVAATTEKKINLIENPSKSAPLVKSSTEENNKDTTKAKTDKPTNEKTNTNAVPAPAPAPAPVPVPVPEAPKTAPTKTETETAPKFMGEEYAAGISSASHFTIISSLLVTLLIAFTL